MERQLKERLVGAAVLVAAAIILVPEMLSGPETEVVRSSAPAAGSTPMKTYSVDLQPPAAAPATPEEEVAQAPAAPAENATPSDSASVSEPQTDPAPEPEAPADAPVATPAESPATSPPEDVRTASPESQSKHVAQWAVQVGSFSSAATASNLAQKLDKQGFNAFVRPVSVGGKQLYRVRIGPMADRGAAEAVLAKVKASQPGASVVPQ